MAELHSFEHELEQAWAPAVWRDVTVVVAVSGGADSVALSLALHAASRQALGRLVVAHFNHRLRGVESDGDEHFVRQLCEKLGMPCEVAEARGDLVSTGNGVEAEARRQRYAFLREVANHQGARYVATAHTADDQAETTLHRVMRGTGLAGLSGIPVTRRLSEMTTLIRPMLSMRRSAVLSYLQDRQQSYREDSSNQLTVFTRNRIRHQLMPLIEQQFNPQVVSSLVRLSNLAREAQQVIDTVVAPLFETSVVLCSASHVDVARAHLRNQPPYLVRELLVTIWKVQHWPRQDMSELKWGQLCELLQQEADAGHLTLPGEVQVEVSHDVMVLRRGQGEGG